MATLYIKYYSAAFIVGALYSQILPTLSLFLSEQRDFNGWQLGLFFTLHGICAIALSSVLANHSDRGLARHKLVFISLVAGSITCLGFAFLKSPVIITIIGLSTWALTAVGLPQLMAQAREEANTQIAANKITLFNAGLRACFALAWVGGPPIGFWLYSELGHGHYLVVGAAYALVSLASWLALKPKHSESLNKKPPSHPTHEKLLTKEIALAVIAFALLYSACHSHLLGLPHFLLHELALTPKLAGGVFGLAAALEIPIMIAGGWAARHYRIESLIQLGALASLIAHAGTYYINGIAGLYLLQIFNAIFIGFVAGLGMTWLQDKLPNRTGAASSLFSNSMQFGHVLGAIIIGIYGQWFNWRDMYLLNAILASSALLMLLLSHKLVPKKSTSIRVSNPKITQPHSP